MKKQNIKDMNDWEIEEELENLKSPFEKIFDKESRKLELMREKSRRLTPLLTK